MVSKKENKRPFAWIKNLPSTQLMIFSIIILILSIFLFLSYNFHTLQQRSKLDNVLQLSKTVSNMRANLADLKNPSQETFSDLLKNRNAAFEQLTSISGNDEFIINVLSLAGLSFNSEDTDKVKTELDKINENINTINNNSVQIIKFLTTIDETYKIMPEIRKQVKELNKYNYNTQAMENQLNFIEYKLAGLLLVDGGNVSNEDINTLILTIRTFLSEISSLNKNNANQNISNIAFKINQISTPLFNLHKDLTSYVQVISSFSTLLNASDDSFKKIQTYLINLEYQSKSNINALQIYQMISYGLLATFIITFFILLLHFREKSIAATEAERLTKQSRMSKSSMDKFLQQMEPLKSGDLRQPIAETDVNFLKFSQSINGLREIMINTVHEVNLNNSNLARSFKLYNKQIEPLNEYNLNLNRKLETNILNLGGISKQLDQIGQQIWQLSEDTNALEEKMDHNVRNSAKTIDKMQSMRLKVQESVKKMKKVGEDYQTISEIINELKEISKKTNVLALNATIQASFSTVENSKEFPVIAQEVQKISTYTDSLAQKIEHIVSKNKESVTECMKSFENVVQELIGGTKLLNNNGENLTELKSLSTKINTTITSASEALQNRSNDIADISITLKNVETEANNITKIINDSNEFSDKMKDYIHNVHTSIQKIKAD